MVRTRASEVLRATGAFECDGGPGRSGHSPEMAGRNRTDFHELLRRHEIVAADYREAGQLDCPPRAADCF